MVGSVQVQETASSQLERLEQLTRRLELLSGGAHTLLQASLQDGNKGLETEEAKLPPKPSTTIPPESKKGRGTSSQNGSDHVQVPVTTGDIRRHATILETGVECPAASSNTSQEDPGNKSPKDSKGQPRLLSVRATQASRGGKSTSTLVNSRRNVEIDSNREWTGDGFDVR